MLCTDDVARSTFNASGLSYTLLHTFLDWPAANALCEANGMQLAIIRSTSQAVAVNDQVKAATNAEGYWIGATDAAAEGTWMWPNGAEVDFFNWKAGEGGADAAQNCAAGDRSYDGRWYDLPCAQRLQPLCEPPGEEGTAPLCTASPACCTAQ